MLAPEGEQPGGSVVTFSGKVPAGPWEPTGREGAGLEDQEDSESEPDKWSLQMESYHFPTGSLHSGHPILPMGITLMPTPRHYDRYHTEHTCEAPGSYAVGNCPMNRSKSLTGRTARRPLFWGSLPARNPESTMPI